MTKYIFVTGGVVSSLGKGIAAAGIGLLLKNRGLNVMMQKLEPYINLDTGTMSPYQHGEVFVTEDGAETDLDLGHYERFIDENLNKNCSVSSGSIYWSVLNKDRTGGYDGATIQVIPHVTDEIKERIRIVGNDKDIDVVIVEVGGTVGDIESLPMLEAIRQVKYDVGKENALYIHLTLVPYLSKAGELKTKPTQHSVKELRGQGIQPDILICRSEVYLDQAIKEKIALFCDLEKREVIQNIDADSIYQVPILLENEGIGDLIIEKLNLKCQELDISEWTKVIEKEKNLEEEINIGLVGKYIELKDAYLSVAEAIRHSSIANNVKTNIKWIHAESLNDSKAEEILGGLDGIILPGGFGERGTEGMISAIRYARENKIPFLGVQYGMQMAVIEFARNVARIKGASSREIQPKGEALVIDVLPENSGLDPKEYPMRLGTHPCRLEKSSYAYKIYQDEVIYERHRHRYEFNQAYKTSLEKHGMKVTGLSPDGKYAEIIEIEDHPFFIGTSFHGEFKSRPINPHPIYKEFIKVVYERKCN